tara:strand:- start:10 stop:369 length:360 start_codon:yes stop_codon:yes gene_type:complete
MNILKKCLIKIKKRKYISLSQAIIFQYIFMFGIFIRPLPLFENILVGEAFWQILYLLIPEVTYYILVFYSVIKMQKLKNYSQKKFLIYILIIPSLIFSSNLIFYTTTNIKIFLKIVSSM